MRPKGVPLTNDFIAPTIMQDRSKTSLRDDYEILAGGGGGGAGGGC